MQGQQRCKENKTLLNSQLLRGKENGDISRQVRKKTTLKNGNGGNGAGRIKYSVSWETRTEEEIKKEISNNKGLLKKS